MRQSYQGCSLHCRTRGSRCILPTNVIKNQLPEDFSYAGDTLYSFTEVLEKKDVASNVGALRLRLVVPKNQPIQVDTSFEIEVGDNTTTSLFPEKNLSLFPRLAASIKQIHIRPQQHHSVSRR
jgi:hypothetical protein